jgi:putative membrane protein
MRRLRGGTLREPLLVRAFGGARLDAVMTGVDGSSEASLLLPPCPRGIAEKVLFDLTGPEVGGMLRRHGRAAVRRRWTRALAAPAVAAVAAGEWAAPVWVWALLMAGAVACAFLGFDRARALGHRVGDGWLVARSGSLERRRDCIAAAGVIGWTVRQSWFQRRAGVATLVAATAAGVKGYRVLDVPAESAWSIAAETTPWVGRTEWAR